jgi:hypothetical protein
MVDLDIREVAIIRKALEPYQRFHSDASKHIGRAQDMRDAEKVIDKLDKAEYERNPVSD